MRVLLSKTDYRKLSKSGKAKVKSVAKKLTGKKRKSTGKRKKKSFSWF